MALGASPLTFAGLAGMGDLILTTTGDLSRNRALGVAIAQDKLWSNIVPPIARLPEGANTSGPRRRRIGREDPGGRPPSSRRSASLIQRQTGSAGNTELMARELKSGSGDDTHQQPKTGTGVLLHW